ncbi:MAG: hypothetical protein GY722_27320, partial [bacterium]|nr:hypothetical protein [bacterium]
PANLGPAVNTERGETDSCISPDGDYVVFTSKRDEGLGDGDLYVSFKLPDDTWTKARNLGAPVNTEHREFCPSVSPDGKYLFFTSRRPKNTKIPRYRNTAREALGLAPDPELADVDIYWLDARYLEGLRPTAGQSVPRSRVGVFGFVERLKTMTGQSHTAIREYRKGHNATW